MEEEKQVPVKKEFLGSLEILSTVKNSQSQNGLKHGDYFRYRRYCTKKIKKIRKGMKFNYGDGKKFESKNISDEVPNDPKLLQVYLYQAERDWAYAMDIRQIMSQKPDDTGNRMKFHVIKKLRRAYQDAKTLQEICSERAEQQTAKEAEAYACSVGGFYFHEKQDWKVSLENYIKSRQIYSELMKVSDSLKNTTFKEKIEQLDQSIRYVYQQNGGSILDSVETILSKYKGDHIEQEVAEKKNFDKTLVEVQFQGQKYPIKNPKVIAIYHQIEAILANLTSIRKDQAINSEQVLNCYIELFSNFDDAIKLVQKDKEDSSNSEAEREIYSAILNYFQSQKFTYLTERNSIHIKTAVKKFDSEKGLNNLPELMTKKAFKLKLTRPAEIVKLCDNYLQVMKQLTEIERKNQNLEQFRKLDGQEILYKGIRCFYVSTVYYANQKYIETISLLNQAEAYLNYSQEKLTELKFNQEDEQFSYFFDLINSFKITAKVTALEQQNVEEEQLTKKVEQLKLDGKSQKYTIQELVESSYEGINHDIDVNNIGSLGIADVPPKPTISGVKPIFIDLAHSYLQYPDVSGKIKEEKKGIFSKFNIWGKK